jgi:ubiquinone/menaquinone biosynthesis C-methylase UbiE
LRRDSRLDLKKALVLDLGCGPADVTIRFAKANPGYKFHGVDGSAAMLKLWPRRG